MFDRNHGLRPCAVAFAVASALGLSGCGGGANVRSSSPPPATGAGGFAGGDITVGTGQTTVWSNDITGSIDLIKGGAGTLVLTGTDSYTGGTTINDGTLRIGNGGTAGSITGNMVDNASLVFDRSDDLTFAGIISGSGSVGQIGTGRLLLTGANAYTGGTTVNAGTLEVGPGGSLGSGIARVGMYSPYYYQNIVLKVDGGISLSNHFLVGMEGLLDNAGKLGGSVDMAVEGDVCDPTYSTCPIVRNHDGGTIQANDHAIQMNSLGDVTNSNGSLIEGGNAAVWLAAGSVTNDGDGSVIRSPNGSAIDVEHGQGDIANTGGALISSGGTAIILAYGGSVTNGAGSTIETQGTTPGSCVGSNGCAIYAGSDLVSAVTLSNEGTILGNVQMVATAYNRTTLGAGSLIQGYLYMGTNQGSSLTLNGNTGTVQRYSDAVTGSTTFSGILSKGGGGSWIVDSDDLDHVAHTYIDGGTLQIGDGGTSGQVGSTTSGYNSPALIQIASGARLVFDRSDDVVYWGYLAPLDSGPGGSVVQTGTGDIEFPDLRAISGFALVVEHGSVTLGDGSLQSDFIRPVSVINNGTLTLDNDGEVYLESVISGSGSLVKRGPGVFSLDETNTYTGSTTVREGTLRTMKLLPGDATVNPGAVLQGAAYNAPPPGLPGTAGDLSNSGRVEVGSGDARIGGSYTQSSTGTLAVSLGSKLAVTGTATLNGGTLEITGADSGYVSNTHTNVLTAGNGVTGSFDQLVKDTGVVFTATTINYDANSVWLDTTGLNVTTAAAGNGVRYTPVSMGSARRVQGAFDQLDSRIAAGDLSGVSNDFVHAAGQFQQAPTLQAAQASLQSLSGQLHAASAAMTFEAIDASSRALSNHFDSLLDKGVGYGMWTHNLSVGGDMARTGFNSVGFQLNGWLVGNDRQIGRSGVAGYAFGQSRGQQRLDQSYDHDNSRTTEGMFYAGWLNGNWYTQGRVGFGHIQQDVNRQILLGQSTQGVGTQYNGNYSVAYDEAGLHFGNGNSHITPFVDVQYARINRDGFAEQGAGGFGLQSDAQTMDRWQAGVGLRANRHWDFGDGRGVDFSARAQWQRSLAEHGEVFDASFVGLQQWQPLVGIGLSRYSGLFGMDMNATLSKRTTLKFSYDYEAGQHDNAQTLMTQVNVVF